MFWWCIRNDCFAPTVAQSRGKPCFDDVFCRNASRQRFVWNRSMACFGDVFGMITLRRRLLCVKIIFSWLDYLWEMPEISGNSGNSGNFRTYPEYLEISGNFGKSRKFGRFPEMQEISGNYGKLPEIRRKFLKFPSTDILQEMKKKWGNFLTMKSFLTRRDLFKNTLR